MPDLIYNLNIIYTAILAGSMIMYSITLGSYFTYLGKNNMLEGFKDYYGVFRKNTNVKLIFMIYLTGQTLLAIISILLNKTKPLLGQILSFLSIIVIGFGHSISGFLKSEEKLNSASDLSVKVVDNYIKYNIPLHILYSIYYIVAAYILLINR